MLHPYFNYLINYPYLVCVSLQIKKLVYFTIQLIIAIVHRPYCTFWYYSWLSLYYFS